MSRKDAPSRKGFMAIGPMTKAIETSTTSRRIHVGLKIGAGITGEGDYPPPCLHPTVSSPLLLLCGCVSVRFHRRFHRQRRKQSNTHREDEGTDIGYSTKWQGISRRKTATVPLLGVFSLTPYSNYGCDPLQYWSSCSPVDLVLHERFCWAVCSSVACTAKYSLSAVNKRLKGLSATSSIRPHTTLLKSLESTVRGARRSLCRRSFPSCPCPTSNPFSSITPHQTPDSVDGYRLHQPRTPRIVSQLTHRCFNALAWCLNELGPYSISWYLTAATHVISPAHTEETKTILGPAWFGCWTIHWSLLHTTRGMASSLSMSMLPGNFPRGFEYLQCRCGRRMGFGRPRSFMPWYP